MTVAAPAMSDAPAAPVARRTSGPRLPTTLLLVAGAVLVANVVVMLVGGAATGVSWDEPTHVSRLESYLATGWYVPARQMSGDAPEPGVEGLYVYGPVASLFGHVVSVATGAEPSGTVATSAAAYASRHLAVGLLGLLCLAAVAGIARLLLGSWRWALLAAAALSALPVWTGHAMFNIKDVPVATGYTLVTLGAVALCRPTLTSSKRLQGVAVGALAAGTFIGVGTRPGLWPAVAASVALALVVAPWCDERGTRLRGLVRRSLLAAVGLAVGGAALTLVYPQVFAHPSRLVEAVAGSSDYPWDGTVLTAGSELAMPPPPSYLPLWFGAQTPLVLLALALVGLAAPAWLALSARRRARPRDRALAAGLGSVGLQALLLPVGSVLTSAVVYDATRQVLFVQPAIAVAATAGAWLLARAAKGDRRTWLRRVGYAVLSLGLVVPTVTHVRLFPYDFVWFNPLAASQPIDGRWMTEYWRTSGRELMAHLPAAGDESCSRPTPGGRLVACSGLPQFAPFADERGSLAHDRPLGPLEYYLVEINRHGLQIPPSCTSLHVVSRPLFGQDVPMGWVARCTMPPLDPVEPAP